MRSVERGGRTGERRGGGKRSEKCFGWKGSILDTLPTYLSYFSFCLRARYTSRLGLFCASASSISHQSRPEPWDFAQHLTFDIQSSKAHYFPSANSNDHHKHRAPDVPPRPNTTIPRLHPTPPTPSSHRHDIPPLRLRHPHNHPQPSLSLLHPLQSRLAYPLGKPRGGPIPSQIATRLR